MKAYNVPMYTRTWCAMMNFYANNDQPEKAIELFNEHFVDGNLPVVSRRRRTSAEACVDIRFHTHTHTHMSRFAQNASRRRRVQNEQVFEGLMLAYLAARDIENVQQSYLRMRTHGLRPTLLGGEVLLRAQIGRAHV